MSWVHVQLEPWYLFLSSIESASAGPGTGGRENKDSPPVVKTNAWTKTCREWATTCGSLSGTSELELER